MKRDSFFEGLEGTDALENGVTAEEVRASTRNVQRDKVLAVRADKLVEFKGVFRNVASDIVLVRSRDGGEEERQSWGTQH